MKFVLNKKKAAQAAAYLISLNGGQMDLLLFIKLLYLADRTALIETGQPITGDKMVSMDLGPVLSEIYDATKPKNQEKDSWWYEYVSERHNNTTLFVAKNGSETDELSKLELKVINTVYQKYGHMDPFALARWTHELPEYRDPQGGSFPIDPIDILKNAGRSDEEIRELSDLSEEIAFLKNLQNSA